MKLPHHTKLLVLTFLFLLVWRVKAPVASEPQGPGGPDEAREAGSPIRITSDSVKSDHKSGWAEFIGNVRAAQEDVVITADRIKVFYKSGGDGSVGTATIEKVVSQGNVKIVFDNETKTAIAEKAVYAADQKMLVLSGGNPTVWSGQDMIRGKKITLFQGEDRTLVEGGEKQQVEATFHTKGQGGLMR
jgi:lipopolysaccharide export system protein LptA